MNAWERIERWLARHDPGLLSELRPGAPSEDLDALEEALGRSLPLEVREAWLRHDGTRGSNLLGGQTLLSASSMLSTWRALDGMEDPGAPAEARGPCKGCRWDPAWVPIAADGTGDFLCIDLDPPEGGEVGQVIEYWHDAPVRMVLAPSFAAWMDGIAVDLQSIEHVEDDGWLDQLELQLEAQEREAARPAAAPSFQHSEEERDARELVQLMVERGVLRIRDEAGRERLVHQVADVLAKVHRPEARARELSQLFLKHPAVAELGLDDEALEGLLEAW